MNIPEPTQPSFVDSLRTLGDGVLGSLHDRIELFALELEEERYRLIQAFVWVSAAIFTGVLAAVFASLTLVYLFWDSSRLAALGGLTVIYVALFVGVIVTVRRCFARQPRPFAGTLAELEEDRACIRDK